MFGCSDHNFFKKGCALIAAPLLFLAMSVPSGAQDAAFPMPEDHLRSGDTAGYLKEATEFLERNPSSRFAPRVAFDILMVASNTSNSKLAGAMKAYLLFEQPRSLQASYVVSCFKEADDFREFLTEQADDRLMTHPNSIPKQFTQALVIGMRHFERKLLDDGSFLIRVHCFAEAAGASRIAETVEPALRQECSKDPDLKAVVDVYFSKKLSPTEKITKLHGKGTDAAFLERFYLSRLSSTEKERPEIVRVLAENAIHSREYEEARSLLGSLPQGFQDDPQILFWKAWTLFALQEHQQALRTLDAIAQKYPGSKWATATRVYAEGILHFTESQNANAEELLAVSKALRMGIGVLEAEVAYAGDSESANVPTYSAYVGIIPDENCLHLCLFKDKGLFIAYRTTARDSAIYLQSDPTILVFREPGPIPAPSVSLSRTDDGEFSFEAGFEMGPSMKQAGARTSTLLDSPYLSTSEGIAALLTHTTRRNGWVPSKPVDKDGKTSFVWHIPATDSPDMKLLEYRVSADHRLTYFKYGNLCVNSLKYSPRDSFKLKPPSWPERAVKESDEFDFSAMMKLIGAIARILEPQQ